MSSVSTAPSPDAYRYFAFLSAPLLIGLFIPGLPILAFAAVPPLAAWLGPPVWPTLSRGWAVLYALGACSIAWLIPVGTTPNLLIPLCGTDWVGTMVPALAATVGYAVAGKRSVTDRRPKLWFLAALLIPMLHGVTTFLLISTGLAADFVC